MASTTPLFADSTTANATNEEINQFYFYEVSFLVVFNALRRQLSCLVSLTVSLHGLLPLNLWLLWHSATEKNKAAYKQCKAPPLVFFFWLMLHREMLARARLSQARFFSLFFSSSTFIFHDNFTTKRHKLALERYATYFLGGYNYFQRFFLSAMFSCRLRVGNYCTHKLTFNRNLGIDLWDYWEEMSYFGGIKGIKFGA